MHTRNHTRLLALVAMIVAAFAPVQAAWAEDVVRLKNGEEVRGEIVRELDGSVWLIETFGTIKRERFFAATQIDEVVRDAASASPAPASADPAANPRMPRGAVISLEGTVGIQMTAQKLRDLIPVLEEEVGSDGSGIVVFKIDSGGGLLLEIQRLSDVIHEEYKPKFRVVALIESAISAAAMTAHCIEEIYFLPEGNYGGCTGWSGALEAVEGFGYEAVVFQMEKISERGGYDHQVMKAMQGHPDEQHFGGAWPLSCTVDQNGNVQWYQSTDGGETLINDNGDVLTFNSAVAEEVRFSKGTVRDLDDLTRAMGYKEVHWVGKPYEGRIYPVGRAEADMIAFREKVTQNEERLNAVMIKYQLNVEAAAGLPVEERGAFVGKARRFLGEVRGMIRENPNFALLNFGLLPDQFDRWYNERLEELREMTRQP